MHELQGRKFGRWSVLRYSHKVKGRKYWQCECTCGMVKPVREDGLLSGFSKSCGCLCGELAKARGMGKPVVFTHGHSRTKEYEAWHGMIQRCHNSKNKDYHNYGRRGISVCERWRNSYENFFADMGKCPDARWSVNRKDNDKGYTPENCEWASPLAQTNNRRSTVRFTLNGVTKTASEWASKLGINYHTLIWRRWKGLSDEECLRTAC